MKKLATLAFLLIFVGCATSPTKKYFPRDEVKNIKIGQTTQRQVFDVFGKPIYYGSREKDMSWWMYVHTEEANSESLSLYFDKEGRVTDLSYSPFRISLKERMN
jgi:outer membrane protein assembly factor BamE (lipoprotein component of BamABCDE complex)